MKAPLIVCITWLCLGIPITAQHYNKKSISGPTDIFLSQSFKQENKSLDVYKDTLNQTIKDGIQMPRFNLNTLPLFITKHFSEKINALTINHEQAARLFTETVAKEITAILNDPSIQQKRLSEQKRGDESYSFADTKGNAQNILKEELDTLFNSAFIYFPYINSLSSHKENTLISSTLSGGIYWYQITSDGSGKRNVVLIKHIQTTTKQALKINVQSTLFLELGKKNYLAYLKNETQKLAMTSYANKLQFETRKIQNFRLKGTIKEAKKSQYKVNIGLWEGVEVDDTFWILDLVEEAGEEKTKKVGFARITDVSNNTENPENFSTLQQLLGPLQSSGGWVKEYPLSKTFFELNLGMKSGVSISHLDIVELQESGHSALMLGLNLSQNLASITGKSQRFIDLDLQLGLLQSSVNSESTGIPILGSAYIHYTKKYWHRSQSVFWKAGIGADYFRLTGSTSSSGIDTPYDYELSGTGISFGIGYEKLITPRLSSKISVTQTISFGVSTATVEHGYISHEYTGSEAATLFNNTHFSNVSARLGVNYNI
jgi:hypothetical protein